MRAPRPIPPLLACALVLAAAAVPAAGQDVRVETYTLPNGLAVILHEDHTLPQVSINTWFAVGSKDEAPGRSGFAHLFEHLMFMGTQRVPGNRFDVLMESGGGANNASTSEDRTNYFSWGPSALLPTLLWLDADRLEGLGKAMTKEKVDLQRNVVRNERRQTVENAPYGIAELIIPEALYPEGHPYHHPVIGSHEDLEAATLEDVKGFFDTYYVPGNASLVVAGDFDPEAVRRVIDRTFGAIPARPLPRHRTAPPPRLEGEVRRMAVDQVQFPRLYLVWHSPRAYTEGDAEMALAASILGEGQGSRLQKRLVIEDRLARDVSVYQASRELGSEFHVEVTAAPGADLERIKRVVLEELERFRREGPSEAEMKRVQAAREAAFLRGMESLRRRADRLNAYYHFFGDPNGFRRDLARFTGATREGVRVWAERVLGAGRLDLRILPEGARVAGADLDRRPEAFAGGEFHPPAAEEIRLGCGVRVTLVRRPGAGLFSGALVVDGGERLVPPEQAGLASLAARMLGAGAGGRDASAFSDAVESLGASVSAGASWHDFRVAVSGLTSRLGPTLDLFADAVLRPNLTPEDFARERDLAVARIRARVEQPFAVAVTVGRMALFGRDDPRGRPGDGFAGTVGRLTRDEIAAWLLRLVDPSRARMVFAGDLDRAGLKAALDERFGGWRGRGEAPPPLPAPLAEPASAPVGERGRERFLMVDRPGAPQSYILLLRPVSPPDSASRLVRETINTLFGASFTSRLNQNIREKHGYSYGARSRIGQDGNQFTLVAYSAVQTGVTGPALTEFRKEFDALARGDVTPQEMEKARKTVRYRLVSTAETTSSVASTLIGLVENRRPLDSIGRDLEALAGVTLDAVNREARSGIFDWGSLLLVIVGDRSAVLPQLERAGLEKPTLVDPEGNPVR